LEVGQAHGRHPADPLASAAQIEIIAVPKRNYGYEKRQKELTKRNKQEEKRQRKLERANEPTEESRGEEPGAPAGPPEE
jgi:hypothetical protein